MNHSEKYVVGLVAIATGIACRDVSRFFGLFQASEMAQSIAAALILVSMSLRFEAMRHNMRRVETFVPFAIISFGVLAFFLNEGKLFRLLGYVVFGLCLLPILFLWSKCKPTFKKTAE